ncbi:MAG: peptidyl-alpha-hydroxyglycine alpha-amidating lyase family protein [Dehalococcoidales bacterium]|nr:peptidyl-alpha-hydroxyglycine alpha-amidating lyase family protein [Dehalococcoidales bacterium]
MMYGSGEYRYELVDGWAKLPAGWSFPDVCGISVDKQDRVYVLNRSEHPVVVFNRNGDFVMSWGEGFFKRAHGSCTGPDGTLYCTDDGNHTVSQFTAQGKLLRLLGTKDQPSDTGYRQQSDLHASLATITHGGPPFNRPTGVALGKKGEIYVADGYGNARVHKFAPDGKLLFSWGGPGTAPGQFRLPHSVWVDRRELIWVTDRENNRIQMFDTEGKFVSQWTDVVRPTAVFIDAADTVYVSELGLRVSIFDVKGKLLARWGSDGKDQAGGLFVAPHTIAVDSRGDIYVGEVARTFAKMERGNRTLMKFARK